MKTSRLVLERHERTNSCFRMLGSKHCYCNRVISGPTTDRGGRWGQKLFWPAVSLLLLNSKVRGMRNSLPETTWAALLSGTGCLSPPLAALRF